MKAFGLFNLNFYTIIRVGVRGRRARARVFVVAAIKDTFVVARHVSGELEVFGERVRVVTYVNRR